MKPRFEEHDNQLFRMLEEHEIVPLKENDANVLVRFITHGVIGEYVREHWLDCNQENVPIYIDDVDSDGDVTVWIDENRNEHHCCPFPMFEIIGYPVEEGSKEWAVQRMKLGDKVTKRHLSHTYWQYDARPHLKCISEYNCGTLQIMVSPEIWLITAEPTGWQLYKEPEYKVGDYIKDGDDYYVVTSHTTCVGLLNGKGYEICPKTCKIVFPSEEVLDFGSGIKGTVRSCEHDGGCVRVISGDRVIAHIMTDALEQPIRNIVKQLLKAQEEK